MAKYGIPYMGSKNKIAEDIIDFLPRGKRFVDLFGGGFSMSHCALLSGKYESVFYNELNPLTVDLIKRALNGDFNYNTFKPPFISREEFHKNKNIDGYVKYIWSFGNDGRSYLFSPENERLKRIAHNGVVFDKTDDEFLSVFPNFRGWESDSIKGRILQLKKIMKEQYSAPLRLQQLERLEQLQRLQLNCGSFLDYKYKDGDIVYCDPPYEGTKEYSKKGFNHTEFYEWVATRPYQVFFSSYEISDKRFFTVWDKEKISLFDFRKDCGKNKKVIEKIYTNGCGANEPSAKIEKQMQML